MIFILSVKSNTREKKAILTHTHTQQDKEIILLYNNLRWIY